MPGGSLDSLLARAVEERDPIGLVNQALRLVAGIDCTSDWQAANKMLSDLTDMRPVLAWWRSLAKAISGPKDVGQAILASQRADVT